MGQAVLKDCPVCNKTSIEAFRPFCSPRCANIDLGKWLGEHYKMPTEEAPFGDAGMEGGTGVRQEEDPS